jgi:predicted RNase H-like nuclease (RuvC/YqgF family)
MTETKTSIPPAEKVTAEAVVAKVAELKDPAWEPRTLGEIGLAQRLALAEQTITSQDTALGELKKVNSEHARKIASLAGECEVLKRICEGYEKETSALNKTTHRAMADAEREIAVMQGLLAFLKKHPLAKDIDFSPLFSA